MRIIDQPFPANGCARLFEINAHDDFQAVAELLAKGAEFAGVFQRADGVVNGAGTDHDQQSRVFLRQNGVDGLAPAHHRGIAAFGHGQFSLQSARRQEPDNFLYM